ncbi:hypothetical protein Taro_023435, partial [Colocasia esculenta]|nr:hypothetical protein [Colocasia esculenta]
IFLLVQELVDSVLWSNVEELWEAPVQPELGLEWRTWKQEVMKLFSTSHPGASGIFDKQSYEGHLNSGLHFSRKRPKLDIRRPYICVGEVGDKMSQDNTVKCGPRNSDSQVVEKCTDICGSFSMQVTRTGAPAVYRNMACKHDDMTAKGVNLSNNFISAIGTSMDITGKRVFSNDSRHRDSPKYRRCLAFMEAKGRQCGRWAKDGDVYCCVHLGNHSFNKPSQAELILPTSMPQCTSITVSSRIDLANEHRDKDSPNKYRQCLAFIEAKGRQCGRWANDGDIYCCVHLSNHSMIKPSLLELTTASTTFMCEGITTHGEKCKHRARPGSEFCKKHVLHRTNALVVVGNPLTFSGGNVKGKHEGETMPETIATTNVSYDNALLTGATTSLMQDNLVSVAVVETSDERNLLRNSLELNDALSTPAYVSTSDSPRCIGFDLLNEEQCLENARKHNLYCEKHVPNFLKRARNGKSRLISKEIFINLLKSCTSRKEKIHLHQACELLYGFMKGSLSHQKLVSQGDIMGRLLSEACKDKNVGEYLLKLVSSEREKIGRVWGFEGLKDKQVHSSEMSTMVHVPEAPEQNPRSPNSTIQCKICTEGFSDDKTLSIHWMEVHKKEAQWLFRGYACAVCMTSFTNKKVQEAHVKEKHGVQFLEGSLLFRCMSCNSHFTNPSELWQHVLSAHSMEFRLPDSDNLSKDSGALKIELRKESCLSNGTTENDDGHRRFVCRFCGLKFDLLPDLGRHHQSAHMNLSYASHLPSRTNKHLKHSRLRHSRFKNGLGATSRFNKSTNFGMEKCFQPSSSVVSSRMRLHTQASQTSCLGRLLESHCFNVAETLFAEVKHTKSRPSNMEILSIARTTCCRTRLLDVLQEKHGILPENLYLKAAKLCSELNIQVNWHVDDFICPNGCRPHSHPHSLSPLAPILSEFVEPAISTSDHVNNGVGEMDESHCVLNLEHFNWRPIRRTIILCEDMSFGQEPVPVACVIDKNIKDLFHLDFSEASAGQDPGVSMPWQGFTYVTKRLLSPSLRLDPKSSQLGCACSDVKCHPETCDHVYLFDNDYENAKDIHGNLMHGRFPYDERGRIIVEVRMDEYGGGTRKAYFQLGQPMQLSQMERFAMSSKSRCGSQTATSKSGYWFGESLIGDSLPEIAITLLAGLVLHLLSCGAEEESIDHLFAGCSYSQGCGWRLLGEPPVASFCGERCDAFCGSVTGCGPANWLGNFLIAAKGGRNQRLIAWNMETAIAVHWIVNRKKDIKL